MNILSPTSSFNSYIPDNRKFFFESTKNLYHTTLFVERGVKCAEVFNNYKVEENNLPGTPKSSLYFSFLNSGLKLAQFSSTISPKVSEGPYQSFYSNTSSFCFALRDLLDPFICARDLNIFSFNSSIYKALNICSQGFGVIGLLTSCLKKIVDSQKYEMDLEDLEHEIREINEEGDEACSSLLKTVKHIIESKKTDSQYQILEKITNISGIILGFASNLILSSSLALISSGIALYRLWIKHQDIDEQSLVSAENMWLAAEMGVNKMQLDKLTENNGKVTSLLERVSKENQELLSINKQLRGQLDLVKDKTGQKINAFSQTPEASFSLRAVFTPIGVSGNVDLE